MSEDTEVFFHDENTITRLAMWSNIVAWIALVLGLIAFGNIAYYVAQNAAQVFAPAGTQGAAFNNINLVTGQLLTPLTGGVFVFFVLRGLSQLLYMGLDMFSVVEEEIIEIDEEDEADEEAQA
ncbi:MAG: hypothetical protein Fur0018_00330 [Anaerolineales bacterium]